MGLTLVGGKKKEENLKKLLKKNLKNLKKIKKKI